MCVRNFVVEREREPEREKQRDGESIEENTENGSFIFNSEVLVQALDERFSTIVITQTKVSSRLIVVERVINVDESNER